MGIGESNDHSLDKPEVCFYFHRISTIGNNALIACSKGNRENGGVKMEGILDYTLILIILRLPASVLKRNILIVFTYNVVKHRNMNVIGLNSTYFVSIYLSS